MGELKAGDPPHELTQLRFIAGMKNESLKIRVLEQLQMDKSMSISDIIDFCQLNAQMREFVQGKGTEVQDKVKEKETFASRAQSRPKSETAFKKSCSKCATSHKARQCPAYGKNAISAVE